MPEGTLVFALLRDSLVGDRSVKVVILHCRTSSRRHGISSRLTTLPAPVPCASDSWPSFARSNSPCALDLVIGSWSCCRASISASPKDPSAAFHRDVRGRHSRRRLSNSEKKRRAAALCEQACVWSRDPGCRCWWPAQPEWRLRWRWLGSLTLLTLLVVAKLLVVADLSTMTLAVEVMQMLVTFVGKRRTMH